ncbi:MAG: hypothetical protein AB7G13_24940 [Lautropia sp.]
MDYTKAHHVTFAELMLMHIDKHKRPKSFGHDFYKAAAWLWQSCAGRAVGEAQSHLNRLRI